jgi:Zn-dependent protease with chaperone function
MSMYPLLCASSCLAVLSIALLCGALLRAGIFSALNRCVGDEELLRFPGGLFVLRVFPFAFALLITTALALPSFLLLEPGNTTELMSPRLGLLAAMGAALFFLAVVRFLGIVAATDKATRRWTRSADRLEMPGLAGSIYMVEGEAGLFAVTGIFRTRIFVGREIFQSLSQAEFAAAVQHELAHVRARDNFRQLIMKITRSVFLGKLQRRIESLWSVSAELAADQAALRAGVSALDLASALVRVARLTATQGAAVAPLAASHLIPHDSPGAVALRVSRLSARIHCEGEPVPALNLSPLWLTIILAVVLGYVSCLHSLLPVAHKAIEIIVR